MYVSTIFVFGTFAAVFFLFSFSLAFCFTKFVCETLCKFLYVYASLKCMFMQYVMINRKFGEFSGFSAPLQKRSIFLLFVSLLFLLFWIIYRKRKPKRKNRFLWCFCPKTSLFVANKTLIFIDLCLYRVIYTPPPFLALTGWVSSRPKFFIFYFLFFFVKYYDFNNSAFLPNFEHFLECHIYFSFCIKFHSIYFRLFLCVR